ncbi:hypothetical protein K1T71_013549 [Dendrolimus kikuchii]|uniref:Uncharacterized protein n=1 Tax=Dendrolimus kikuchii TaxID=765133 RepID=A0ACC1CGT9_9NEOP|nr:hypothetical protein K1T71_013549 [Dendrolimus kikuchii]
MQKESAEKPNTSINKAENTQEVVIVHEEISQKLGKPIQEQLLNKEQTTTNNVRVPQDIIIVHEEVTQKCSFEKENEEQLLNKVSATIDNNSVSQEIIIVHEEASLKSNYEKQKEKQKELLDKVNKKTAEYQANKPSSGVFTEVVTHGAFTPKTVTKDTTKLENATVIKSNGTNGSKTLLGFPSSANDLALDAKSDLESDPNISSEVKGKVIEKLFSLVSMVQHVYESKVRIMTEFEKFKDTHLKNELRREKEHSEQLYKLNMNFQNEVVQSIQRLKSELDISRTVSKNVEDDHSSTIMNSSSVDFNTSDDAQDLDSIDKTHSTDDLIEQSECLPDANEDDKVNQQD